MALYSDYSPLSLPMTNAFLTIKQAAKLTSKSEVTIRRLIKRLLKHRTAQTDQMITMTNRHGSSVYTIQRKFLIEHVNLPDEIKQQLLNATDQTPMQVVIANDNDQALNNQTPGHTMPSTSGLNIASTASDYSVEDSTTQANSHTPAQPNQQSLDSESEQRNKASHSDQSPTQTNGHFSEDGFALLSKTVDRLSTQLDKKDDQIAEKDKQLARLDTQLNDEKDQVKKLTQIIEQGNLLVHSAQQRIPLPSDDITVDLVEASITKDEEVDFTEFEPDPIPVEDESVSPEKRGVVSRLLSRFSRSDS